jgi:small subunit ribosomal protein S6
MTRQYKATIILDTRGYSEPVETLQEKVTDYFKQAGGQVTKSENLGRQEFVRITEKGHTGDTYLTLELSGDADVPSRFQELTHLDRKIKRALIARM